MNPTIIPTVLSSVVLSAFVSGIFSWLIARRTFKAEIQKLLLELDYKVIQKEDEEFEQMVRLVTEDSVSMGISSDTLVAISIVRSKASGSYAKALDDLLHTVRTQPKYLLPKALSVVVEERSKLRSAVSFDTLTRRSGKAQ